MRRQSARRCLAWRTSRPVGALWRRAGSSGGLRGRLEPRDCCAALEACWANRRASGTLSTSGARRAAAARGWTGSRRSGMLDGACCTGLTLFTPWYGRNWNAHVVPVASPRLPKALTRSSPTGVVGKPFDVEDPGHCGRCLHGDIQRVWPDVLVRLPYSTCVVATWYSGFWRRPRPDARACTMPTG